MLVIKKGDKVKCYEIGAGVVQEVHDENLFAVKFEQKTTRVLCKQQEDEKIFTNFDDNPKRVFPVYE